MPYALDEMNSKSHYPVVGVVESGVLALKREFIKRDDLILIIATKATVKSKRYQIHLENLGFKNIIAIQTGLFVPLVEEGIFDGEILDATMRHYFRDIPTPRAIILGCTHFPLISSSISRYFNDRPLLIHSGDAIVEYLKDNYLLFNRGEGTDLKIFASENVSHLRDIAKYWLSL